MSKEFTCEGGINITTIGDVDVRVVGTAADGVTRMWLLSPKGDPGVELVLDSVPRDVLAACDGWIRDTADAEDEAAYQDARERGYTGPRR